jgi:hypothetical protein
MGRPSVQVSQDLSIENESQRLHVEISSFDRRRIMEHQEDPCDGENDEKETRNASQTECIGEPKAVAFDFCGKDMKEEVVVDEHGSLQIGVRYPGSEDGMPDGRI